MYTRNNIANNVLNLRKWLNKITNKNNIKYENGISVIKIKLKSNRGIINVNVSTYLQTNIHKYLRPNLNNDCLPLHGMFGLSHNHQRVASL